MTPQQAELFARWLEAQKNRWATCNRVPSAIDEEFHMWLAMMEGGQLPTVINKNVNEVWTRRNKAKGMK